MSIKTVIACGGTGGHLFPGIAVAEALIARGGEVLVLISEKEIDALAIKGHGHLCFETLPAIAMPPLLSLKIIPFGVRFLKTLSRCKKMVGDFGADAVLGMGGFTSLAPLMAGRRRSAKTFIHESNAFPGKANRVAARSADVVLLGLEACRQYFPGKEVEVVGTPLRSVMLTRSDRAGALRRFGLEDDGRRTLLVMGGSQGARGLNRGVTGALDEISAAGMQVIHLAGPADVEETRAAYAGVDIPHHVAAFSHEMEFAYAAADIAIARSGASSLAELSAFGIPTILVPYPFAADDHQTLNAAVYTEGGAALLLKESDLNARSFGEMLAKLMGDDGARLKGMRVAMQELAVLDAAENICHSIEARCQ